MRGEIEYQEILTRLPPPRLNLPTTASSCKLPPILPPTTTQPITLLPPNPIARGRTGESQLSCSSISVRSCLEKYPSQKEERWLRLRLSHQQLLWTNAMDQSLYYLHHFLDSIASPAQYPVELVGLFREKTQTDL